MEVDEKYGFNCRFSQVYMRTILRARRKFPNFPLPLPLPTFSNVLYYYKLVCLFENASLLFYSNSSSAITSCKLENCIVMSAPSGHMIPNLLFFLSSPLSLARCVWVCERACLYLRECASVVGGQRKQVISENWQIFSNAYQQNWWTRLHALIHTNVENENVNESDY